jgi:hypothetical protein
MYLASSPRPWTTEEVSGGQALQVKRKEADRSRLCSCLDVINGIDLIAGEFEDDAEQFLDYFEKTWIGETKNKGELINWKIYQIKLLLSGTDRKKSLFPIVLWNVHDRVSTNFSHSSNSCLCRLFVILYGDVTDTLELLPSLYDPYSDSDERERSQVTNF